MSPTASLFAHNETDAKGVPIGHLKRMARVCAALTKPGTPSAAMWHNQSARLLMLAPGISLGAQLGPQLAKMLMSRQNVRIATVDPAFGAQKFSRPYRSLFNRAVTLPYLVRASFSRHARDVCRSREAADRSGAPMGELGPAGEPRTSVVFHGNTGRFDHGQRAAVRDILRWVNGSDYLSSSVGRIRKDDTAVRAEMAVTEQAMLRGALCFAPAGDTPASRRLFEALAAGCTPIISRPASQWASSLPFGAIIDWKAIAYFLSPAKSSARRYNHTGEYSVLAHNDSIWASRRSEAAWVDALRQQHPHQVRHVQAMGYAAFCSHLDPQGNPEGVADALLASAAFAPGSRESIKVY